MQMSQRAVWLGFNPTASAPQAQGTTTLGAVCGADADCENVGRFGSSADVHRIKRLFAYQAAAFINIYVYSAHNKTASQTQQLRAACACIIIMCAAEFINGRATAINPLSNLPVYLVCTLC